MDVAVKVWRFCVLHRIAHFLFAGCISTFINLAILRTLTEGYGVWYLYSEVPAFIVSYAANFALQRHVTFKSLTPGSICSQMSLHLPFQLCMLGADEIFLYLLVTHLQVWYLLAQVLASAVLAVVSFLVTRWIFKQ